jgi:broad specificity phosphatase PhoE
MSAGRSLLLVRHGRTVDNAHGRLLGRADPELDELGRRQAEAVGAALRSGRFGPIAAVVSSPLRRARATADALGLPVRVDDRLVELDYGELEGTPVVEVPPATWAAWRSDPHFRPPGGESLVELGVRVREACVHWSSVEGPAGAVVLVSHVSPVKAATAWALGVGDEIAWRSHLDNASISQVLWRGDRPVLSLFNDTAHLADLVAPS